MAERQPWDQALLDALSGDDLRLTLDQLAAESGVSQPLLEVVARSGLLLADDDGMYSLGDAQAVQEGLRLVEAGLPLAELLELARRLDVALQPLAADAVDVFARFVRDSVEATSRSEDEASTRLVEAFSSMLPVTGDLVARHFRNLVLAEARRRLL